MNAENPYKTPETINPESIVSDGSPISSMDRKRFKKLYYRSVNINTIAVLLLLSVCFLIWLVSFQSKIAESRGEYIIISPVFYVSVTLSCIATIGLFMRSTWGRIVGILACIGMIFNLHFISIIVGIAGLFALFKAPELFGPKRILHKDLKKEYKIRKREKRFK